MTTCLQAIVFVMICLEKVMTFFARYPKDLLPDLFELVPCPCATAVHDCTIHCQGGEGFLHMGHSNPMSNCFEHFTVNYDPTKTR